MVRGLLAALVVLGSLAALPAMPAAACSCAETRPVAEALDLSAGAFTGTVTRNEGIDISRRELDITVDEVFKGSAAAEQLVVTHAQGPACGISPDVGTEALFLVTEGGTNAVADFARSGELVVGACGGQRPVSEAAVLGQGRPPDGDASGAAPAGDRTPGTGETTDPDLETGTFLAMVAGIGAVLVVVAVVVVVAVRRRRARSGRPA
jgi:hypothetical protein